MMLEFIHYAEAYMIYTPSDMKTLVVYYTRTGTTARIAHEIAAALSGDIEEIIDRTKRKGTFGWFIAGRDGMQKRTTSINLPKYDPSSYDLVIMGTPIWVNASPAIRTYAIRYTGKFKRVALFCTMGGSGGKPVFEELTGITRKKPAATMDLKEEFIKNGTYRKTLAAFISKLKK